jgi:predicted metal-dependent peptidase
MSNQAKPELVLTAADNRAIESARMVAANFLPWWSPVIRQLKIIRNDHMTNTMGVGTSGKVHYNLAFLRDVLASDGIPGLAFVLLHEGLHLISNSHKRGEAIGAYASQELAQAWNIACDMSINSLLCAEAARSGCLYKVVMPKSGALPADYEFPDNLSAEEYYLRMLQSAKKSGGGGKALNGCGVNPDGQELSAAKIKQIKQEMANASKKHIQRGEGALGELLQVEEEEIPKVDWRKQLVHVALRLTNMINGSDDSTYSRRNVRTFDEPDAAILPGNCSYELSVVVIGDTSGSMSGHLGKIVSEVNEIVKILGKVTFIACDYAVHSAASVGSVADVRQNLKGGGGTSMVPAFEEAKKYKPSLIVCITDGAIGHTPGIGVKTIWCLTENYTHDVQPSVEEGWGTVVECLD